jgi:phenylalanyl-tRNA synthetase beta chain
VAAAGTAGAMPVASSTITLRRARIERLTGLALDVATAAAHLRALEFDVTSGAVETLDVRVPSFRRDVALEDDLVEEVARAHGYDAIPEAPLETLGAHATRTRRELVLASARRAMLARGVTEAWTTTLVSGREAHAAAALLGDAPESLVRLANPMSRESEVLRPNPVPGLLRAVAHNLKQGVRGVRLFEVGAGFAWGADESNAPRLPQETPMLAAVATGPLWAHAHDPAHGAEELDFFAAKGLWQAWLEEMRVDTPEWRSYAAPGWKPGASAEVVAATSRIAWAGVLAPPLLRAWDIEVPVQLFVALLEPFLTATETRPAVRLPARFPPVRRDLAFFVPQAVTHRQVERTLVAAAGERLASIELFDVYHGPQSPPGMKSLAYGIAFQHSERTLTEPEVQTIQDRMVAAVAREWSGHLREQR